MSATILTAILLQNQTGIYTFEMVDENGEFKAHLRNSRKEGTHERLELDELGKNKEAEDVCPVDCIHVTEED